MTAFDPGQQPTAAPPSTAGACCRARCRAPAGRSSGSGCGRRSLRSRPPSACSCRCPGSGCGSRCRRSAAPSACSCSLCSRSPRPCRCSWCGCRAATTACAGSTAPADLPHRPATAIADDLAPEASDSFASALWRAHVERALRAARTLQGRTAAAAAGGARSLCAARAGADARGRDLLRRRQRAHQAHRRGVRLAGRGGAGQLPHRRLGDAADLHRPAAADPAGPASRRAGARPRRAYPCRPARRWWCARPARPISTSPSRAASPKSRGDARPQAPAGTEERRYTITDAGSATVRGAGDNLVWSFTAIPDRVPTIALAKEPEGQSPRLAAARLQDRGRLRRDRRAGDVRAEAARRSPRQRREPSRRGRSTARRTSRWCCRSRAPRTASARPSRI